MPDDYDTSGLSPEELDELDQVEEEEPDDDATLVTDDEAAAEQTEVRDVPDAEVEDQSSEEPEDDREST